MHGEYLSQAGEQPSIDSIQDLIPEFPLASDEIVVVNDDNGRPDHVLIPSGIVPADRCSFKVRVLRVPVRYVDDDGRLVWSSDSDGEIDMPVKKLLRKAEYGDVIEQSLENYTVESDSDSRRSGGHPAQAA